MVSLIATWEGKFEAYRSEIMLIFGNRVEIACEMRRTRRDLRYRGIFGNTFGEVLIETLGNGGTISDPGD